MFEFTHRDGRKGEGWSVWAAIVASIGAGEANALPDMEENDWSYPKAGDVSRESGIVTIAGDRIGTVREFRPV